MNDAPHPALLPAGLYDLLPPDAEIEAEATARLMGVLASHGYQRVEPPLVGFEGTLLAGARRRAGEGHLPSDGPDFAPHGRSPRRYDAADRAHRRQPDVAHAAAAQAQL